MVSAHIWLHPYSPKTETQTPGQQVRYLRREGEFAPAHYVNRTEGRTKDYNDYVVGDVQNLPAWSNNDPHRFFSAAKAFEGVNRYYAFQVEFSLPKELSHEQQMALRQDLMDAVMSDLPALWVKHEKRLESGELHPHIHILFSARKHDGIERDEVQTFQRWNRAHPERGGCQKEVFWSKNYAPEQLRQAFSDITNYHLDRANAHGRVDARSLRRRDIHRHAVGRGLEVSLDAATSAKEQAQAARAWEYRKARLGLEDIQTIPREEFVLMVRQWTKAYIPGRATMTNAERQEARFQRRGQALGRRQARVAMQLREVEQAYAGVVKEVNRTHAQVMIEEHRQRQREQGHARDGRQARPGGQERVRQELPMRTRETGIHQGGSTVREPRPRPSVEQEPEPVPTKRRTPRRWGPGRASGPDEMHHGVQRPHLDRDMER